MNILIGVLTGLMLINGASSIETNVEYGIVMNEQGDGKIVVNADDYYNYISYSNIEGVEIGDCIKTTNININGECEYRYDEIVETRIDRYEGDDINEYCIFEIHDDGDIITGECSASTYINAVNMDEYSDMLKLWE